MWITGLVVGCGCLALATGCLAGSDPQFITDVFSHSYGYRHRVELGGTWEFHRDKDNKGKDLGWHEGKGEFKQTLRIPGAPQAQGIGEPSESMKSRLDEPFWTRRTFAMPHIPAGKRVWLRIGGILPAAEIYLNGRYIGYTQSSRTRQRVDVTDAIKPGAQNLIAIKVCDWPKVKLEGIWEMAEIQRVWTGIYGPISLEITDAVSIVDIYAKPDLAAKSVHVNFQLSIAPEQPLNARLCVKDRSRTIGASDVTIPSGQTIAASDVALSDFTPWSPDHPKLYDLTVDTGADKVPLRFGMREIASIGNKFYLNGKPVYLRAFGDDQLYCHTIAPPVGKDTYLPMLKRARAYGLNAATSCEETFNQDYIEAADEAGIMIIQDIPFPTHLLPYALTSFVFREMTWNPSLSMDELKDRVRLRFFGVDSPKDLAEDFWALRELVRESGEKLAQGEIALMDKVEGDICKAAPSANPKTLDGIALMRRAIDDIRKHADRCGGPSD